jgi:AraC-like DNA-binding protein
MSALTEYHDLRHMPIAPGDMPIARHVIVKSAPATPSIEPTVLAAWTATLVRALDARGLDGDGLAVAAGIDPAAFRSNDARIPLSRTTELWRLAVEATGDPCLGLEVSRHVRPTTFHSLSLGIVASDSFRDALDRIVRFSGVVLSSAIDTEVVAEGDRYVYTATSPPGVVRPSHESMEGILASIVRAARLMIDRNVSPEEVWLERPEAPGSRRFEDFFGCPVRYGCDHHRLVYDAALADRMLPTGSADLGRVADRLTTGYLERVRPAGAFTERVREVVASRIDIEEPTPSVVAAELTMSPRTLQRHLQSERTTFRDVVADVRIARAKQLLDEGLATDVVAHRLWFSDSATFRRAFKRLTGMTAGEFASLRP